MKITGDHNSGRAWKRFLPFCNGCGYISGGKPVLWRGCLSEDYLTHSILECYAPRSKPGSKTEREPGHRPRKLTITDAEIDRLRKRFVDYERFTGAGKRTGRPKK